MYKMKEKIVLKEFAFKYFLFYPDKLRRNKKIIVMDTINNKNCSNPDVSVF